MDLLSSSEIKHELTIMLKDLDNVLTTGGYKYSIIAGTLLGAIRHKGFIPWDDDLDIAMPRKDYDKFIKDFRSIGIIQNHYKLSGYEIDGSDLPYLKFENLELKYKREDLLGFEQNGYLWIDIFPIDNAPDRNKKMFYTYINKIMRRAYTYERYRINDWSLDSKDNMKKRILRNSFMYFFKRRNGDVISKYIKACTKLNKQETQNVNCIVWGIGEKEEFSKALFDDIIDYQFEDIYVKGFHNADEWLTRRYGDYMVIPSKENQISHNIHVWHSDG